MRVGFIGWRGMVGSVLMERMRSCGDFAGLEPSFFSTSAAGGQGPEVDGRRYALEDAHDIEALRKLPVLVCCQGSEYTHEIYPRLRAAGWDGYFIDAAKTLRMNDDSVLILDPVNRAVIDRGLASGIKTFCGPNCTVSLMLMAIDGLLRAGLVEWVSSMTYQAASGAGAQTMRELIAQMSRVAEVARPLLADPASGALELDARVAEALRAPSFPIEHCGAALAGSLIPWIDKPVGDGQTLEEWKAHAEGNKILGGSRAIAFDGLCVRIGAMRCHSQGLTIKLTRDVPLDEVLAILRAGNPWVRVIANERAETLRELSPAAITGKLEVAIGRIRKMRFGPQYLTAFTVGDQLLWGAAEPLRRMLGILREHLGDRS
ncbi:MAG: aspartate-semialdehyde dehydrogenase [Polyangiales bacterium]